MKLPIFAALLLKCTTADYVPVTLDQLSLDVGIFKNGFAYYHGAYRVPRDGTFVVDGLPEDIAHGTFAVTAADPRVRTTTRVETVAVEQDVDYAELLDGGAESMSGALAGLWVVIARDGKPTVAGEMLPPRKRKARKVRTPPTPELYGVFPPSPPSPTPAGNDRYFAVRDKAGDVVLVDISSVMSVKVRKGPATLVGRVNKKVTTLTFTGVGDSPSAVSVSYLAPGLTWAPSYQLNVTDAEQLTIQFQAQVRNEGEYLNATSANVVTGYPNLQFKDMTTLLHQDIHSFLAEADGGLGAQSRYAVAAQNGNFITQNAYGGAFGGIPVQDEAYGPEDKEKTSDMVSLRMGPLRLDSGEAMQAPHMSMTAPYERVVEWNLNDNSKGKGEAWDALRFKNPFAFPLTTAPASIVRGSSILGQSQTKWTAAAAEAVVRVTKALSVRVSHAEVNAGEKLIASDVPQSVQMMGLSQKPPGGPWSETYRVTMQGELTVVNIRNQDVLVCAYYDVTGTVAEGQDGTPKLSRSDGGDSLNLMTNIQWELALPAGGTRTIKYTYTKLRKQLKW